MNQLSVVTSLVVVSICIIQLCGKLLASSGNGNSELVLACGLNSTINENTLAVNNMMTNPTITCNQLTSNTNLGNTIRYNKKNALNTNSLTYSNWGMVTNF